MMTMLDKIHRVIRSAGLRDNSERTLLRPIDLLDIANIIGENVVSGGVRAPRRSASSTRTIPSAFRPRATSTARWAAAGRSTRPSPTAR